MGMGENTIFFPRSIQLKTAITFRSITLFSSNIIKASSIAKLKIG